MEKEYFASGSVVGWKKDERRDKWKQIIKSIKAKEWNDAVTEKSEKPDPSEKSKAIRGIAGKSQWSKTKVRKRNLSTIAQSSVIDTTAFIEKPPALKRKRTEHQSATEPPTQPAVLPQSIASIQLGKWTQELGLENFTSLQVLTVANYKQKQLKPLAWLEMFAVSGLTVEKIRVIDKKVNTVIAGELMDLMNWMNLMDWTWFGGLCRFSELNEIKWTV